jgi:hypothetical protein
MATAAASLLLLSAGLAPLALLAVSLAYGLLYISQNRQDTKCWLGNPLRIALPLFLLFQVAYCLWCALFSGGALDGLDYQPEKWGYPMELAPLACCEYLLLNYVLFLGIHFGYRSGQESPRSVRQLELRRRPALALCFVLLAVAVGGFLVTYGRDTNLLLGYLVSNSERFICFAWFVLTFLALAGRWQERLTVWLLHILCLAAGIYGVLLTRMRFLVFEQIASVMVVWFSCRPLGKRLLVSFVISGVAILFLFTVTTNVKRSDNSAASLDVAPAVVDALLGRAASFHADAILEDEPSMRSLFTEYRGAVVKELLVGVPFSGLFTGVTDPNSPMLDMRFAWWNSGHILDTSFFVSGVTALRYTFGLPLTIIASAASGILLGLTARNAVRVALPASWLLVQAAMLPVALHGYRKSDFLRIATNLLLFWLLLRVVCRRKSCGIPSLPGGPV